MPTQKPLQSKQAGLSTALNNSNSDLRSRQELNRSREFITLRRSKLPVYSDSICNYFRLDNNDGLRNSSKRFLWAKAVQKITVKKQLESQRAGDISAAVCPTVCVSSHDSFDTAKVSS
ncbi:hypothetical protein J6590_004733 [Homalodisca vitripennis]|nr:hypothetical protein J6590_004733 [Homalodisca vitripennis]